MNDFNASIGPSPREMAAEHVEAMRRAAKEDGTLEAAEGRRRRLKRAVGATVDWLIDGKTLPYIDFTDGKKTLPNG